MIAALLFALTVPVAAPAPVSASPGDPALFDAATGYRIAAYRGVIPAAPPDVERIDDGEAAKRHDGGHTLFIDLTPARGAVRDAATGEWRLAEPHETIPGAHWFPEAGRGPADAAIDRWFAGGISRLTKGSHRRPIVAFCLADCWMSWNAAWKLRRLGYRAVAWYANGIDGWRDLGRPLVPATPEGTSRR
ncbi:rhodanese-like domain-containing protein [Sphingomonas sp.]|uniref:rhodanese-like domain-containing protein n=1 Tax=Sphingomonas sp. TaxID=28214 RepID=UPI000DB7DE35|nr:rhodanese-like domain-containing protein [Sphingomonas sp.]PZU09907.1 MAG: rhodanese [Sphingomonas sp.]